MWEWELLDTFFTNYNIAPLWLDYTNESLWYASDGGKYDDKTKTWSGAMGLVRLLHEL